MPVTIQDVAALSGFSIATVSRVLNNTGYPVSVKARRKVMEAAQTLGYRPNLLARGMRTEHTKTVGIIADDLLSPFTPPIIRGIQDYLNTKGYLGLIVNADREPQIEEEAIGMLLSRAVDGFIFVESGYLTPSSELATSQKPFVYVHRLFGTSIYDSVVTDDFAGAVLAVEHLVSLGHQRIAHVAGPQNWYSSVLRYEGYLSVLSEHGLPVDSNMVSEGDWEYESGERAMAELLNLPHRPTAVFIANDEMTLGALAALRNAQVDVPGEIAIVSYDNRNYCRTIRPKLTSVSLPVYRMGVKAAEILHNKLQGETPPVEEVRICGRLFIRESCGADPAMRTADEHDVDPLYAAAKHRK
jgi:LacI family transcriptional regulator